MKNIAKALSDFQKSVPDIKKSADNPYFKSKYASLEEILPVIKKPLEDAGLVFTQIPTGICKLTTKIIHIESGELIEGEYEMTPSKNDPQGHGATITYMRRYALVSMLSLNCEEDDDGNTASGKQASKATTAPQGAYPTDRTDVPFGEPTVELGETIKPKRRI